MSLRSTSPAENRLYEIRLELARRGVSPWASHLAKLSSTWTREEARQGHVAPMSSDSSEAAVEASLRRATRRQRRALRAFFCQLGSRPAHGPCYCARCNAQRQRTVNP